MLDLLAQVAPMQSASRSASVRYRGQRQVSPRRHACRVAPKAGARVRPAFPSALQPAAQSDRASLEAPAQTVAAQPLLSDARRSRRASGSAVCGLGASELRAPPSLRIDLTCSINYDVVFKRTAWLVLSPLRAANRLCQLRQLRFTARILSKMQKPDS